MVQLVLTLCAILLASPAWSATYYVAPTGNNSNAGTDEDFPKLTVAHCVSIMVAGDTCLVKNGTYNEGTITFSRSGTQATPIRLANYPGHAPKIQYATSNDRIFIRHASGQNVAIGWIIIDGLELTGGHDGVKYHSLHDSIFRNLHIHDNGFMGILGIGGLRNLFERNIIHHNGRFVACDTGASTLCVQDHGLYIHGQFYTIRNNLFWWHQGYGIQQNGSGTSSYDPAVHASAEFAGAQNWIVSDNTFAYSKPRGGMVVWGGNCANTRIENNIFYENAVESSGEPQGIKCTSCSGSTGIQIRNNHFYASGSGGTASIGTGFNADLVTSGNVVNVSPPGFVNGGSNSLPANPDFRLTASSPVNMARMNEFPNTTENVVGVYKAMAHPTLSITANKITGTYNAVTPIQVSSSGVSVSCTGSACPVSPTVGSVSKIAGTDAQFEVVVNGIAGNACVAANQTWTLSYNSSVGSWSATDNIGPAPGLHQKMFSFTNRAVTNNCTGSGPPPPTGGAYIEYLFTEGTGTTATNTGSFGASGNGTLENGVTWASGGGVTVADGGSQRVAVPWGAGVNPSTQSLTIEIAVFLASGVESGIHYVAGPDHGANQRAYVCARDGTWRVALQTTVCSATAPSNLAVSAGLNHLVLRFDSGTDVATLYQDGVAGTGGATASYTSYTFASNWALGRVASLLATGGTYGKFTVYLSLEDPAALFAAFQGQPTNPSGTFSQTAVQFEAVYLSELGGSPTVLPSPGNTKNVVKAGAVVLSAQIECNDCEETAFRLEARDNGVGAWMHVSNAQTSGNIYMWGANTSPFLNNGARSTRILANGCTVVTGTTQLTATQILSLTLPASGCAVLSYIVRVRDGASGYTELRIAKEGGIAFAGSYVLGRIDVINQQAGGVGF